MAEDSDNSIDQSSTKTQEVAGPDVSTGEEESPDLTPSQVRRWLRRIKRSQTQMMPRYRMWDKRITLLKASEGQKTNEEVSGLPETNVNLMPSTLAIVMNNLISRDREVYGFSDNEEISENILPALQNRMRRLLRRLRYFRQLRRAVRDMLVFGPGFIEVGFSTEHFAGGDERTDGRIVETHDNTVRGLPWMLRVSPRRVYVDPEATDLDDARWLVTVERRPKEEMEKNPNYQNVSEIGADSSDQLDEIFKDADRRKSIEGDREGGNEERMVTLYKVQDKATNSTFVLAEGLKEKTVIRPVVGAFPFSGFSLVMFSVGEVPDEFWPLSEFGQWEDHQRDLSELRSTMMDSTKRLALIWLVGDEIADDELDKLMDAKTRTFVKVADPSRIQPLPAPAMPQEWALMDQMIQNTIREVSGISDFERGGDVGAKTATEVTARQNASVGRGQPMRDDVSEATDRVMDKIGVIMTTLMTEGEEEPIEEGEITWQMDAATAQAFSPAVRRKLWNDTLTLVVQIESIKPGTFNIIEVVKRWMQAMDVRDSEQLVFENVSPGSGLTPDAENLLLMAGLPVQPSEDEDFASHLQEHAKLQQLPEYVQGVLSPKIMAAIDSHIETTANMAEASGVILDEGGPLAPPGAPDQLAQSPVSESALASASER